MTRHSKRILDLLITLPVMLGFIPAFVLLALLVRVYIGKPVIFRQTRPGLAAQPFAILKFRTMSDARDAEGKLLPDNMRLKRLGRFLRATSLDELPELFNVVKGDMSLVGPRPLLMQYLPHYSEREKLRHSVRPGITGWAQVHGRNLLPWDDRLGMDVWYVENWSISLDLKILAMTVYAVLKRDGVAVVTSELEGALDKERQQPAH